MSRFKPGDVVDDFEIVESLFPGGMAHLYRVKFHNQNDEKAKHIDFEMIMKVPRMSRADGSENIVSFEVEQQILPVLTGNHVPRFVAAGNLSTHPYLVMEYVSGKNIQQLLDEKVNLSFEDIARIGLAMAHAIFSLHKQNVCHLDLKPANVILRDDGTAVLIDFGLSYHAHLPDLLAEEMRQAVGSPAWIAPEQVVGTRGDPRSDLFAVGVILYELATLKLPFGVPRSVNGLRNRLWMDPAPPRKINASVPEWLQEVILKCLEPEADNRYPSASHLAMDLSNIDQIEITARGKKTQSTGFKTHFLRWIKAAGLHYKPSPLPARQIEEVPILMVAVPSRNTTEQVLYSLREAVARSLGIRPGARLTCVTVIEPINASLKQEQKNETQIHRAQLVQLQKWAEGLDLRDHQVSYHVIEATDVAEALIKYAESNLVNMIIMGAATHGLKLRGFVTAISIRVAMRASCTVILVK